MRVVRPARRRVARTTYLNKVATLASLVPLALWAASAARAQAEEPGFDLQWSAPAPCASESTARGEISALIREPRDAGERARARVQIEGSEQRGYVARIEIARGASAGERELRGRSCEAVAEAAVLIIAMAIDPQGVGARAAAQRDAQAAATTKSVDTVASAPTRAPAREAKPDEPDEPQRPAQEGEAEEPEPVEVEEEAPSDPRRAGRLVLGLHGQGDAGSLPHVTVGGGLLAGMHWQHVRLELQATAYLPQREQLAPAPGSTAISLYTGALSGCVDLLGARDESRALGACAAVEAGLSRGVPESISDGQASSGFWLASFLGLDVRQRVTGPLHVRLLAEAGLPVLRPRYEIEPFGLVFRAAPVLGRFGISAFVLFP
jgi:hypothetical protein